MKNVILLILLNNIFILQVFAQSEIKCYDEYVMPDIKRHKLTLFYNISNTNRSNEFITPDSSSVNSFLSLSNSADVNWFYFKNTQKYQGELNLSTSVNSSIENKIVSKEEEGYTYLGVTNILNSINRFYIKPKFFVEANLYAYYFYNKRQYKYIYENVQNNYDSISQNNFITINPRISVGTGRIEDINDLTHAMFIMRKLQKEDACKTSIMKNDIMSIAKHIARIKNKRVFDNRTKNIIELEYLDSVLNVENLIKEKNIKYFAHLQDMWKYGEISDRKRGKRISAGILYRKYLNQNKYEGAGKYYLEYTYYSLSPFVKYESEKPVSLYLQRVFSVDASFDLYNNTEINGIDTTQSENKNFNLELNGEVGVYPNTRTSFKAGTYLRYGHYGITYDDLTKTKSSPFDALLYLENNWYISPRISVYVNSSLLFDLYKNFDSENNSQTIDFRIIAGINLNIF